MDEQKKDNMTIEQMRTMIALRKASIEEVCERLGKHYWTVKWAGLGSFVFGIGLFAINIKAGVMLADLVGAAAVWWACYAWYGVARARRKWKEQSTKALIELGVFEGLINEKESAERDQQYLADQTATR